MYEQKSQSNTNKIIGATCGSVGGVAVVAGALFYIRKKRNAAIDEVSPELDSDVPNININIDSFEM